MRKRRPHVALGRGRKLLDAPGGLLGQRRRRPLERREREPPGLVGERDGDVGAAREPLDERPLRRGEILESVRVDGAAVPGGEIAGHAVRCVTALTIAVPPLEPVELVAVRPQKVTQPRLEVLGLDEPRLQLRDRGSQCLREPGERRRGAPETAQQQPTLRIGEYRAMVAVAARDAGEQVVERADGAAHDRLAARHEVVLHALNLRPVRDDEHRIPRDVRRIAVEQEGDLAGVRRPREQCQRHVTQSRLRGGLDSSCPPSRFGARRLMSACSVRPLRTSAAGRGGRPYGRVACRHSCRRGRPAWSRASHPCT